MFLWLSMTFRPWWRWKEDLTELGVEWGWFFKTLLWLPEPLPVFHIMSKLISSKCGQLQQLPQLLIWWSWRDVEFFARKHISGRLSFPAELAEEQASLWKALPYTSLDVHIEHFAAKMISKTLLCSHLKQQCNSSSGRRSQCEVTLETTNCQDDALLNIFSHQ